MIIAIGSDLCNIEQIENSLSRFGERFEQRVFTETERAKAARRPFTKAGTLAQALRRQGGFQGGRRLQGGRVHEGRRRRQCQERRANSGAERRGRRPACRDHT